MTIVNISEAKNQLSALIQKVEKGEEVIIVRNNEPVATLIKFRNRKVREGFGSLKGKVVEKPGCWEFELNEAPF